MSDYLLISDAAKEVSVESHVLRYWEEELHLPIKRNELGHRYYTKEDVERFKQIKDMKEKGLQLKAIKMILKDGKLSVLSEMAQKNEMEEGCVGEKQDELREEQDNGVAEQMVADKLKEMEGEQNNMTIDIVNVRENQGAVKTISSEDKAYRLQWLLKQLIRDTLQENNQELCREIKESVVKELDYQFRNQEEREEERERLREQRTEEHYQRIDELLRKKSKQGLGSLVRGEKKLKKKDENNIMDIQAAGKKVTKKKRHFIH